MTADKPSNLAPKLRFSEFRDAPDWEEVSLGTFLVRAPEYGVNAAAVPFSGTLPTYIRITDINSDGQFAPCPRVSVDIAADEEQYLRDGDIVLARTGASVGKSYRYREEDGRLVYAGFLIRVRPNPQRLLSQFLAAYLSTGSYWDWVRLTSARSGQPGINGAEYASMPLPLPASGRALAEQQKIANCLGSLDDLIAADGRKLEALRQHKQGLMQQLFPQPGQSRPRLRFPEFCNAVEWQRCALGEIAEISKGKGISKSDVVQRGRTPCVRYGELYTSYGEIIEIIKSRTNLPASDLVLSNAGDVIIPASGETKEDIATCACVVDDGVALGSDLNVIRSPVDGRFFSYYLNGSRRRELAKVAQGDTVAHLYPTQLSRLEVYIPDAKAEQQRIADCLSSLDARLAAQVQKLNALKTHKQGLLQQIFPSLESH